MIATIIMWIVLPMFLGAIALGYGFWTWNAAVDMVESVRDRSRSFPIESETFTWIILHLLALAVIALVVLEQVTG